MIAFTVASAMFLAAGQNAAANSARQELIACLSEAVTAGKAAKMAADAFPAFAREQCATPASSLKAALVAIDVKHNVPRKQAAADAEDQVMEFVGQADERFKAK